MDKPRDAQPQRASSRAAVGVGQYRCSFRAGTLVVVSLQATDAASISRRQPTEAAKPTRVPTEQSSTARLLKRAIVANPALFVQQQTGRSDKAYAALSETVARRLSLFDLLGSPEALGVLASLSGYYLGARGEELYSCLVLRKGKSLEPYLEQYRHNGNPECSQELGSTFTKPSSALDGYALCRNDQRQKAHLATLIAAIYSASPCSDSEFAALSTRAQGPGEASNVTK